MLCHTDMPAHMQKSHSPQVHPCTWKGDAMAQQMPHHLHTCHSQCTGTFCCEDLDPFTTSSSSVS
jgi:hypothetical protein